MHSSTLYHLSPIEIATGETESLTSYLTRLAAKHQVKPYDLITSVLLQEMSDRGLTTSSSSKILSKQWKEKLSTVVNGLTDKTHPWVETIESLTLQDGLEFLTMLSWREVISPRGLMSKRRRWCPYCYAEQYDFTLEVYNPLVWSLNVVELCDRHGFPLQAECPFCGKSTTPLSSEGILGFCPYCCHWLGDETAYPSHTSHDEHRLIEQIEITDSLKQLIAIAPQIESKPNIGRVSQKVTNFIDIAMDGSGQAFAKLLGLHHTTVYAIRDGKQIPQLPTLLKISSAMGISLTDLLLVDTPKFSLSDPLETIDPVKPKRRRYRKLNKRKIKQQLQELIRQMDAEEIERLSMAEVAEHLDYDKSYLRKHFPVECTTITEQYAELVEEHKQLRFGQERESIRSAMLKLHEQGTYPSLNQVGKTVGGILKDVRLRDEWRKYLIELGYNS